MIPPHELKNKSFSRSVRGYNISEVDEYLSFIIEKYTELYRANDELEKKLRVVKARLDIVQNEEHSIQSALIDAHKTSKDIIDGANTCADNIVALTKKNCNEILVEFGHNLETDRRALADLKNELETFRNTLLTSYSAHIDLINSLSEKPIADSAELCSKNSADYITEVMTKVSNEMNGEKDIEDAASDAASNDEADSADQNVVSN